MIDHACENRTTSPPRYQASRILVVDDEEQMREIISLFLNKLGYQAVSASDGRDALTKFRDQSFDLVLSDVRMPGLNGLQLLKAIKDSNPRIPVVLISGYADIEIVVEALKAGAENFLPKPVKMSFLGKVIQQSLSLTTPRPPSPVLLPEIRQITQFQVPSQPEFVKEMVHQLALSAVAVGFAPHDLDNNLKLVLHEAITNAMEHGNNWDPAKLVMVKAETSKYEIRVCIQDEGPGFDYAIQANPTDGKEILLERGRGIFLIKTIMDEVKFTPPGNQITLVKFKSANLALETD